MSALDVVSRRRIAREPASRVERLRGLQWLAMLVPVVFLGLIDAVRHVLFSEVAHTPAAYVTVHGATMIAVALFTIAIFRLIGRFERQIATQNA